MYYAEMERGGSFEFIQGCHPLLSNLMCKALMSSMARKNFQTDLFLKLMSINTGILRCGMHTLVSLAILLCLLSSVIFIWTTEVDLYNNKFLIQGAANKEYFLSLWLTAIEIICFGIYSAIDVLSIYEKQSTKVVKIRIILSDVASHVLFSIVFPLSSVILILFWGFYFWNRELIYPKLIDEIFPPFLNHMMHTYPVPLSILYMITDTKKEPPKSKTLVTLTSFLIIYGLVFFEVHKRNEKWIYPFFEDLTPSQITRVILFTVISPYIFCFLGYYAHSKIKVITSLFGYKLKKLKGHES